MVEVTQSKVAIATAQTRLTEAQYDNKIAEVTLANATGGQARTEFDPKIR